jgi:hypothetical protein
MKRDSCCGTGRTAGMLPEVVQETGALSMNYSISSNGYYSRFRKEQRVVDSWRVAMSGLSNKVESELRL